jgi:hypothetical protein
MLGNAGMKSRRGLVGSDVRALRQRAKSAMSLRRRRRGVSHLRDVVRSPPFVPQSCARPRRLQQSISIVQLALSMCPQPPCCSTRAQADLDKPNFHQFDR